MTTKRAGVAGLKAIIRDNVKAAKLKNGTREHAAWLLFLFGSSIKTVVEAEGSCLVPGLGTFRRKTRKARRIRNVAEVLDSGPPVEGDLGRAAFIELPATPEIRFRPAKAWKKALR